MQNHQTMFFTEICPSDPSEDGVAKELLARIIRGFSCDAVIYDQSGECARVLASADPVQLCRELPRLDLHGVYDPTTLFIQRQLRGFVKRFLFSKSQGVAQETAARTAFLENQTRLHRHVSDIIPFAEMRHQTLLNSASLLLWKSGADNISSGDLLDDMRNGPGSSIGVSGSDVSIYRKLVEETITGSGGAIALAACLLVDELWMEIIPRHAPLRVDHSEVLFVLKDNDEKRTIAREQVLNMLFQQAIGAHLTRCLRALGIHLNSGQDYHRALARDASMGILSLATADLKKASDSVLEWLVRRCFEHCPTLLRLMDMTRNKIALVDGEPVNLACYSTMGNAFTFPLQTLIFYALVRTVCRSGTVTVYGDDIIYPVEYRDEVFCVLSDLGFLVNQDKSFSTGGFRESCGGDYYLGTSVRPFNPERPDFSTANSVRAWVHTTYNVLKRKVEENGSPIVLDRFNDSLREIVEALDCLPGSKPSGIIPRFLPDDYGFHASDPVEGVALGHKLGIPPHALPRYSEKKNEPGEAYTAIRVLFQTPLLREIENDGCYYLFNDRRKSGVEARVASVFDPPIPMTSVIYAPPYPRKGVPGRILVPRRWVGMRRSTIVYIREWMWALSIDDKNDLLETLLRWQYASVEGLVSVQND